MTNYYEQFKNKLINLNLMDEIFNQDYRNIIEKNKSKQSK